MAYRETEHTLAKKADTRLRLLKAARRLVQQGGFAAASASAVAKESGVASGTIYRHFPNKSELVAEVFRYATEREVAAVAQACDCGETAADKLTAAVETFAQRALLGRTLAYALIAEPVDPRVEQERLRYRFAYAEIFEDVIALGIQRGEFVAQNCQITAAALVGLLAESLVGPLKKEHEYEHDDLIHSLTALVLRAVGFKS
ncbi:Transcriptional regulator, TetR family [Oleispira antarctica RB-8]|uniref:Transcriptional regulator, TetR family n=1 Tax=Oleispira antarctica RB-8 TaxID=698738 RepID=R4YU57_OLEAN|nr:Transcriptional regulator, TetR family [Oleispira antarctica RB-8]